MQVLDIKPNGDGTETITLDMTEEEQQFLIEYAVTNILKEQIERMENESNLCTPVSDGDAIPGVVVDTDSEGV
jgi:HSP90 family molecular chaperone